jgi:hypothetical protein
MITGGFVDWAVRVDGPRSKTYATVNAGAGIVWHSMEGWWAGSLAELMKPARQASWMFSIRLDGTLVQHYPVTASCWASGNSLANTQWWSVELEGIFSTPINAAQLATARRLIGEWLAYRRASVPAITATRTGTLWTKTMWEHREVDVIASPNAGETACPSERYALLWAALAEEDEPMTEAEKRRLEDAEEGIALLKRIVAGNGVVYEGNRLTGEAALAIADERGWSAFLGLYLAREDIAGLQVAISSGDKRALAVAFRAAAVALEGAA